MPRASWRGFLRLSLVSCPIYLSPATTRTKPVRLHQVWQPARVDEDEVEVPDRGGGRERSPQLAPSPLARIPAFMEMWAPPLPALRSGRMIPKPARRLISTRS
jgi:hypothetical protein